MPTKKTRPFQPAPGVGEDVCRARICGDVYPPCLIGLEVIVVREPDGPGWDRLLTVRFADRAAVAAATDGKYGYYEIRLPNFCLEKV